MNLKEKIKCYKEYKKRLKQIKNYQKIHGKIVTARDMKEYVFNFGVVPTPLYTKGIEYKQIVDPRTIYAKPKVKKITIDIRK